MKEVLKLRSSLPTRKVYQEKGIEEVRSDWINFSHGVGWVRYAEEPEKEERTRTKQSV